jgi:hypothetical protein
MGHLGQCPLLILLDSPSCGENTKSNHHTRELSRQLFLNVRNLSLVVPLIYLPFGLAVHIETHRKADAGIKTSPPPGEASLRLVIASNNVSSQRVRYGVQASRATQPMLFLISPRFSHSRRRQSSKTAF